ncbi:SDR family NAD(P)-dependent oxidoreductase [Algibacillus agarilyticus]|uniref:SDR family NAD(P)-dependent oxidoreductase n=1 Tax=Algibacillus agarilyticus TaxID=2234133 RepID=UPI001300AB1C|nr:SDR family NAD(P)-dependent oxidoreductase [Algibacillus agarilyticus]
MINKKIIILGVNADIGMNLCLFYLEDGYQVIGTYRSENENYERLKNCNNLYLVQCDLTVKTEMPKLINVVEKYKFDWDCIFSSVGTSKPIGRFFDLDFDTWSSSVDINSIAQLRAIHALYPYRNINTINTIALLAGGGTNNPFRCYSAYCVAKIMLIKMCELLDDENPELNVFIVGPGFVRTKTHLETLSAGELAEDNLSRVQDFWDSKAQGTSMRDIYECIQWLTVQGRSVAGGRNFSVVHDQWGREKLSLDLKATPEMYKLRRFANDKRILL